MNGATSRSPLHQVTGDRFLEMTGPAARHLFDGIDGMVTVLHAIDWAGLGARSVAPETRDTANLELQRGRDLQFSLATLCGAVLHIADNGLQLCSANTTVPASCDSLLGPGVVSPELVRYCVGREVHGLPVGVLIRGARHQAMHWTDEREYDGTAGSPAGFSRFTQAVFDHLLSVHYNDFLADMVYDLGNPMYGGTPVRAADLVLGSFGWRRYSDYEADMHLMLGVTA